MKKTIALVLALLMALSLVACGSASSSTASAASGSTAAAGEDVTAYFVGIMSGGAAWGQAQAGFEAACEELGWEGYYVAPTTPNDTTQMVNLAETAITNGAQVLIGTFYDADIFGDVCSRALEAGAHVATTNCYMTEDLEDFWIGTDPDGMGISQAKTLVDVVGDNDATVVYMQTQATSVTQNQQFEAFSEYLKDYSNITIYGQEFCNSDTAGAADKISALVKANPDINAVVCADGNGCLGLANYVDETGCKDTFYSVGIDDSADILNYITTGALDCTIAQDFYKMGYESCMMLQKVLNGETVEFDNDSGTVVVYADDVKAYAADKGIEGVN